MRPSTRDEFEIAIVCALPVECDAVLASFDETFDKSGQIYGKHPGDVNVYANGRIGLHNVVLSHMPGMGKVNAAGVASHLCISFPGIKLALVVGICGGVPFPTSTASNRAEVILGDVVVSDCIVEYDFGRQYPDGFRLRGNIQDVPGRPSRQIRAVLSSLKLRETRRELENRLSHHLRSLQAQNPIWQHPGAAHDVLFEASYRHRHYQNDTTCVCADCWSGSDPVCEEALLKDCKSLMCAGNPVIRERHTKSESTAPCVHIGPVACGDTVMKSGEHRDKLAEAEGVIGFEMEGAGVWDILPCVIIKGVCDYADSHKDKRWQAYAAATGASGVKAFLEHWRPSLASGMPDIDKRCLSDLLLTDPRDDKLRIEKTRGGLLRESFSWVLEHPVFHRWRYDVQHRVLWIRGDAGKGETMLMIGIIDELTKQGALLKEPEFALVVSYFICQGTDSRLNNAASILRGLL
ncbi:nucleoside phosphorylase domain-containing protein [Aspergillus pseudotamarii]|uniref:Nucleoside phosphorylase domain-containing protein n=1 Tax=Aspergillus pseudotamarii TaxID=132259 RepID=A0A5N6SMH5_ASPPS|nr:nucleoside phosphorylase domain-containing protein [Aspergillus pseudotamarii]KAE8135079.1 nucleoside phosphorylase domain-containing protein [Aspergillus pseudotamarii]